MGKIKCYMLKIVLFLIFFILFFYSSAEFFSTARKSTSCALSAALWFAVGSTTTGSCRSNICPTWSPSPAAPPAIRSRLSSPTSSDCSTHSKWEAGASSLGAKMIVFAFWKSLSVECTVVIMRVATLLLVFWRFTRLYECARSQVSGLYVTQQCLYLFDETIAPMFRPVSELSIPRGVNAFCYSEKSNIFATGGWCSVRVGEEAMGGLSLS